MFLKAESWLAGGLGRVNHSQQRSAWLTSERLEVNLDCQGGLQVASWHHPCSPGVTLMNTHTSPFTSSSSFFLTVVAIDALRRRRRRFGNILWLSSETGLVSTTWLDASSTLDLCRALQPLLTTPKATVHTHNVILIVKYSKGCDRKPIVNRSKQRNLELIGISQTYWLDSLFDTV